MAKTLKMTSAPTPLTLTLTRGKTTSNHVRFDVNPNAEWRAASPNGAIYLLQSDLARAFGEGSANDVFSITVTITPAAHGMYAPVTRRRRTA